MFEDVTGEPDWPLEGFGSVWALVPDQEEPAILRIDPATNEIIASVPLPGQRCQGFTVSDDAVWACVTGGVVRIDPETNAITDEVPFETAQVWSRLAFGAGSVWAIGAADAVPNQLVRIDPGGDDSDLHSARPWRHEPGLRLRRGLGQRFPGWACPADRPGHRGGDRARHRSSAADGDRGRPGQPVGHPLRLGGFAPDEPTVVRIDPTDGSAVTEIATGVASLGKGGLWATDEAVWVRAPDTFLTRIDPATNEVVETITGPPGTGDVTVAFDSVWITAGNALTIYRMAP